MVFSGKSTLVAVLLRVVDLESGQCCIDGIDIKKIPRSLLRQRLICLSQNSLFVGSFRFNLDPNGEFSETEIMDVLRAAKISDFIESRGGLTADMDPDKLSHGERQLLSMSWAVLRKRSVGSNCILVVDEVTSGLDSLTDQHVREIIEKEFRDNTVITVTHRQIDALDGSLSITLDNGTVVKGL